MLLFTQMACFACFGLLLVLVGGNQAELAAALRIDLAQSGLLVSAFTLGAGVGIVAAGPIFDRSARRPLFVGSLAWVAVVLMTTGPSASYRETALRLVAVGMGAGAYNTVVNASLAERHAANAAGPLALVHGSATIGAIAAAPLFGWVATNWHFSRSFQLVGLLHGLLAVVALGLSDALGRAKPVAHDAGQRLPLRPLLPFLGIAFAYVGIEGTLTVFAVPYASGALGLPVADGRLAISALWLGILAGRALLFARRRRDPGRGTLWVAGLLAAGVLACGGLLRSSQVGLFFGLAGMALGALYPLTMTMIGERFCAARGTAAGLAGGAGAVGGVVMPWLAGTIGDRVGAVATVWVCATLALGLVLCALCLPARVRAQQPP